MPSDFDMLAQIGPPGGGDAGGPTAEPSYDPRFGKQLQDAMAQTPQMQAFRELGAQSKVNADLMKLPQPAEEMSMKTDPKTGQKTVTVKTTEQNYQNTMDSATKYHQVLAGFVAQTQQAEMRLRMQEEQARNQSPWIQLATALAANMAQAKDLPGWVQAAGRTSAQLNPRPEEIGARRMAVIEQGAQMAEKGAALDIAELRTLMTGQEQAASLAQKADKELGTRINNFVKDARLSARAGEPMPREAFEAKADLFEIPQDKRDALYVGHVAAAHAAVAQDVRKAELAKAKMTFGEQLAERLAATKGEISKSNRLSAIDQAFRNSISGSKEAYDLKLYQQKEAIKTATAGRKELEVLGPKVSGQLQQASATNQYIGTTQEMLQQPEFAEVQGPLFQFDPATKEVKVNPQAVLPKQFKNVDRTIVESQIAHEIPRLLTLLLNGQQGGASILRLKEGQKLIKDMGITGQIRTDQALQILKIVRDSNNNTVAAAMREKPRAAWNELKDLTGASDPLNDYYFKERKDMFGKPLVPFPTVEGKGEAKGTPAISKDDFDQWLKGKK